MKLSLKDPVLRPVDTFEVEKMSKKEKQNRQLGDLWKKNIARSKGCKLFLPLAMSGTDTLLDDISGKPNIGEAV